jgi:hypothetical protein
MPKITKEIYEASVCLAKSHMLESPSLNPDHEYDDYFSICSRCEGGGSIDTCISTPQLFCGGGVPGPSLSTIFKEFLSQGSFSKHKIRVYTDEVLFMFGAYLRKQWWACDKKCKYWELNILPTKAGPGENAYTHTHGLECITEAAYFCNHVTDIVSEKQGYEIFDG